MKVLLDECVPRKVQRYIVDHECLTVPRAGLAGKKNGELLDLAERLALMSCSRWIKPCPSAEPPQSNRLPADYPGQIEQIGRSTSTRAGLSGSAEVNPPGASCEDWRVEAHFGYKATVKT